MSSGSAYSVVHAAAAGSTSEQHTYDTLPDNAAYDAVRKVGALACRCLSL